ncbi:hypothetical protein [Paraburkholderia caribensis]|uniref:hypothetical protein n=1 Tax=Paraburkholderia caribensis TaxID=75105 RepID=UPI0011E05D81|nr:hypothetical protein [Paraburkholderia caribensis]
MDFIVTPYGFCTNSFSLNPFSQDLKCFDDSSHFVATASTAHTVSLDALRKALIDARDKAAQKPSKTAGHKNQIAHAECLIAGVAAALWANSLTAVFPEGQDHSLPQKDVFE